LTDVIVDGKFSLYIEFSTDKTAGIFTIVIDNNGLYICQ